MGYPAAGEAGRQMKQSVGRESVAHPAFGQLIAEGGMSYAFPPYGF